MFVVRVYAHLDDKPELTESKPALNSYYSMLNTSVCLEREYPERLVLGSVYDVTVARYGKQTYLITIIFFSHKPETFHKHYFPLLVTHSLTSLKTHEKALGVDNSPNRFITDEGELHPNVEFIACVLKGCWKWIEGKNKWRR